MKAKRVEIRFNEKSILALVDDISEWVVNWEQIERIGYRTTADGPWKDDYFLVLKTKDQPPRYYDIPLSFKGALELAEHINQMVDSKIPKSGILANCPNEDNVTIWPSAKSGEAM